MNLIILLWNIESRKITLIYTMFYFMYYEFSVHIYEPLPPDKFENMSLRDTYQLSQ